MNLWQVYFFDERANREGSQKFESEESFRRRIEEIRADIWLKFIKGILPEGIEIR